MYLFEYKLLLFIDVMKCSYSQEISFVHETEYWVCSELCV
jgi:hypothetical protein